LVFSSQSAAIYDENIILKKPSGSNGQCYDFKKMPKRWKNWRFLTQDAPLSLNVFQEKRLFFRLK
jgi:hypothetical protein